MSDALDRLWAEIQSRRDACPDASWTARLLARGPEHCARKFGEEAIETVVEGVRGDRPALTAEAADAIYHLMVLLTARRIAWHEVLAELDRRAGTSGLAEKAARSSDPPSAPTDVSD